MLSSDNDEQEAGTTMVDDLFVSLSRAVVHRGLSVLGACLRLRGLWTFDGTRSIRVLFFFCCLWSTVARVRKPPVVVSLDKNRVSRSDFGSSHHTITERVW